MISKNILRATSIALAACGLANIAGCSDRPRTVPVHGVLTWSDGKPISGATIRFVPLAQGGREANGFTNKDGDFTLASYSVDDGAVPGEYAVCVIKTPASAQGVAPPVGDPANPGKQQDLTKAMKSFYEKGSHVPAAAGDPIPENYKNEKTTPLKCTVRPGEEKIQLKVIKG
jgi:hypothetical protein